MVERTVRVVLQGDASSLVNAATQGRNALRELGNTDSSGAGRGVQAAGEAADHSRSAFEKLKDSVAAQVSVGNLAAQAMQAAFGAIGGAIGSVLSSGMAYQDTLLNMGAITRTSNMTLADSAAQMAQVSVKARELGRDITIPGASATDAAMAMTELAKAGFSVGDSMTAAKGTLQLAAAASISAAQAAEIQANTMNAYHLAADQAGHVADVLANVANAASGSMTDFSYALTATSATANSFGISLEDTNTTLGLFANAGIKGEEAGTLMKTMLTHLAAPTQPAADAMKVLGLNVYDASGKFVGMSTVTDQLRTAHENLSMAAYNTNTAIVFGTRGIKGAAILGSEAATSFGNMHDAIMRDGTAADVAKAKMSGLSGSFENLNNQIQDAQLTVFGMFADQLTGAVNNFAGVFPTMFTDAIAAITYFGTQAGIFLAPIITAVQGLAEKVGPYVAAFAMAVKDGVTTALDAIAPFGQKIGELIDSVKNSGVFDTFGLALVGVGDAFKGVTNAIGPLLTVAGGAIDIFNGLPDPIRNIAAAVGAVLLLSGPLNTFWLTLKVNAVTAVSVMKTSLVEAGVALRGFELTMAGVATAAKGLWTALGGPIGIAIIGISSALALMSSSSGDAAVATADFTDAIDSNTGALANNAVAIIAKKTADSGSAEAYQKIGGNVADYTAALAGNAEAQDRVHTAIAAAADAAVTQDGQFQASGLSAHDYAQQLLSTGLAASTGSDGMKAAGLASADFAKDTGTLTAEQQAVKLAIEGAGNAAGAAAPSMADAAANQAAFNSAAQAGLDPTKSMKDELKDLKSAASEAGDAADFLWLKLEQLHGGEITAEDAARVEAAAMREIGNSARNAADAHQKVIDAQQKFGDGSPQMLQALSDEQAAVDKTAGATEGAAKAAIGAATAAWQHKAALGDMQGASEAASNSMATSRQTFIDAETQINGGNVPAAEALADKYHLIPSEVVTTITAQGMDAAKQHVDDLNAALDKINNKTYHYTIQQDGSALAVTPGGTPLVGAHDHAEGGWITGPGGPKEDKVKANLSPHEFVVNAAQAIKHGALLEAINNGAMGFAEGGAVPDATATTPVAGTAAVAASAVALPDVAAFQAAWLAIAKAVQDAWAVTINPTLLLLAAGELAAAAEFLSLQKDAVEPSWAANSAAITASVNTVIGPTYDALNAATNNVAATIAGAANGTIIPTFGTVAAYIMGAVNGSIGPTYDAWNAATLNVGAVQVGLRDASVIPAWQGILQEISAVWSQLQGVTFPQITQGLWDLEVANQHLQATTDSSWTEIGNAISNTYNGQIVPAWTGVQNFTTAMGGFFSGISAGMTSATSESTNDISQITTAINDFFAMVAGKTAGQPAAAAPAAVPGAADGGYITAGTGPRTDDVAIRVSKGEYVVNAAATEKHKSTLDSINYGGAYADGGVVGDKINKNVHDTMMTGTEKAIEAGVARAMIAMAATGGAGIVFNGQLSVGGDTVPLPEGARGKFMEAVASKMGTSYVWGAAGPDVFDCSGLMSWALDQAGVNVGRLTAQDFNASYPHIGQAQPGDLVTFDTGRLPGQAGHIGAVLDVGKGLMMNTDGSGPAKVANYVGRDGGPLSILDPIGGQYTPSAASSTGGGDPPSGGWLGSILSRIKAGATAVGNVSYNATAGVEQWRGIVDQSLQILGQPVGLDNIVLNQMSTESSGNPNAINLTDSNAQRGTPSKGLVQVIDPTFATYAIPPYNTNIYDPLSNVLAGENYAIHAYGSLAAGMRGVAYDGGGMWPSGTAGVNLTGKKEAVLAPDETRAYKTHAASLAAGLGGHVLPPNNLAPVINVAAPRIELHMHGDVAALNGRIDVRVNGALSDAAVLVKRGQMST